MAKKGRMIDAEGGNLYKRANDMFVKVTAAETNGTYEICEERCPPGFASRRHMHTENFETFFIIEGSATFELAGDIYDAQPGQLFHIPPKVPHKVTAGNDGVRMLMVYSPGTTEAMFQEMVALSPEQRQDFDTGKAVAAKHNTVWVGGD